MKHFIVPLLFIFIISCNRQNSDEKSELDMTQVKNNPPVQTVINLFPDDPVLLDLKDTVSKKGPKNITRSILQDKKGNIWLASWQGIIRYDGEYFTNITLQEGLGHYPYCSILEDTNGKLWFGTIAKGMYCYDGKNFTHYTTKYGLAGNTVFCMLEDKSGNIWFGTDSGISCYNGTTFTNFTTKDGLFDNTVYSMLQDSKGKLWFGTKGGVCCFSPSSLTGADPSSKFTQKEGPFANVRAMIEDKEGNIWFGTTNGGLSFYDGKTFTYFTNKDGLSSNYVGCLMADKNGNIWSGGDVNRYDPSVAAGTSGKSFTRIIVKEDQNSNNIFCIFEDKLGNIWFGTSTGVCRYDTRMNKSNEQAKAFNYFTE